jgi:chromate transporter
MSPEHVFVTVLLASLLGFGGLGSLPVLRSQLSGAGIAPDNLILHAVAVGNISPGPNGLYLVAVGYFVGGASGALVSCLALMIPPILVLGLQRLRDRLIHRARFRAALQSLGLAVVALLASTSTGLVIHAGHGVLGVTMIALGTVLVLLRLPPLLGVLLAIGTGLVFR